MKRYISRKQIIIAFVMIIIFFIAFGVNSILSYTLATLCFWAIGTLFSLSDIRNRFTLLSFNVGFFLFLIGGYVYHWMQEGNWNYFSNSPKTILHTCYCLAISMFTIVFFSVVIREDGANNAESESSKKLGRGNYQYLFPLIKVILVVSFLCELMVEIVTTYITRATSYALSLNISTGLPTIVTSLAAYYYIALFLYWSLFPEKKGTILSFLSLALIEIIILISGERGEPISLGFTLVFYIFMRQRKGHFDIKIAQKYVVLVVLITPLLISSLQALSYSRVNREYDASVTESVEEFFETQGGSVKIIANGYDLYDKISEIGGHSFVLGTVRNYVENNIFARIITGKERTGRTTEDAYSGNSYIASYGYSYAPYTYSKGVGSGSTYIAEVYQDGGYIFLVVFNIFLAFLFRWIDSKKTDSIIVSAIILNVFRYMVLLPRGLALQWLTSTFAIQNIILFVAIIFLNQLQHRRENSLQNNIERAD